MTSLRGALAASALSAVLLASLAACSSSPSAPVEEPGATTDQPASGASGGGQMYGCTDAMLAYLEENGYPESEPIDPATIAIPETSFSNAPTCLVVDDYGGSPRYAGIWTSDIDGVLAELGAALTAGGYEQSGDYGPYVWWLDGTEPTNAAHAISAVPQPIDGTDSLWAAW